jgi:hypothetical protein
MVRRQYRAVPMAAMWAAGFIAAATGAGSAMAGAAPTAGAPGRTVTKTATAFFGFSQPYAGDPRFVPVAPREVKKATQLNAPLGQALADRIARDIGLRKSRVFTAHQYDEFITGKGVGGKISAARLVDASVRILTNTVGRPTYSVVNGHLTPTVLASYGLWVNRAGLLESPANTNAPTRKINKLLVPGGYLGTWCRANGAETSLRQLYRSAYTSEVVFGNRSQHIADAAQLVPNTKGVRTVEVGMSMAPSIWMVNFALIYTLNPKLAADMPAEWAPIPAPVASALHASRGGRVPYADWASYFASHS